MDRDILATKRHRANVVAAIVLSILLVLAAAILGRSPRNLAGSLTQSEPSDVTAIALVDATLEPGTVVSGIEFLRKNEAMQSDEKPTYDYLARFSSGEAALIRLAWSTEEGHWEILTRETLHGE